MLVRCAYIFVNWYWIGYWNYTLYQRELGFFQESWYLLLDTGKFWVSLVSTWTGDFSSRNQYQVTNPLRHPQICLQKQDCFCSQPQNEACFCRLCKIALRALSGNLQNQACFCRKISASQRSEPQNDILVVAFWVQRVVATANLQKPASRNQSLQN